MKKLILIIVLAILLSFGVASGQDEAYSVGVKAWFNSWELEYGGSSETTDPTLMVGPIISIKHDRLFGGATLLFTPDEYEWSYPGGYSVQADRTDLDLIAGYMFHPRVGCFVGYRYLSSDLSWEDPIDSGDYGTIILSGPFLGVTANIPVIYNIVIFGSFSYMFLDFEWEMPSAFGGSTYSSDAAGVSIELGAAYIISSNWNVSIGYKSQSFKGDIDVDDLTLGFTGLTFGANYRF